MLARCLARGDDQREAFQRYEATRLARTARLQLTSRANTWGKRAADPSWVYGYDVLQTPIAASGAAPTAA